MGGSRVGNFRKNLNLIFTMTIAGLWHGASLNFLFWGFLNGIILSIEKYFNKNEFKSIFRIIITCFITFNLWIVFRITEIDLIYQYFSILYYNIFEIFILENFVIFLIVCLFIYSQNFETYSKIKKVSHKINLKILVPITIIVLLTGLSSIAGQSQKFIYFQF